MAVTALQQITNRQEFELAVYFFNSRKRRGLDCKTLKKNEKKVLLLFVFSFQYVFVR